MFCALVISCGVLETPRFGRKSNFLFVPNTKVTFECNQEFVLIGDQRRSCSSDGKWDIPEYGYTECLREYWFTSNIIHENAAPIIQHSPFNRRDKLFFFLDVINNDIGRKFCLTTIVYSNRIRS